MLGTRPRECYPSCAPLLPGLTCPPGSRLSRRPRQTVTHAMGSRVPRTAHGGRAGRPSPLDHPPTGLKQRPWDSPPPRPTHTRVQGWGLAGGISCPGTHSTGYSTGGRGCTHHTQGHTHSLSPPRVVSDGGRGTTGAGTQRGHHQGEQRLAWGSAGPRTTAATQAWQHRQGVSGERGDLGCWSR